MRVLRATMEARAGRGQGYALEREAARPSRCYVMSSVGWGWVRQNSHS